MATSVKHASFAPDVGGSKASDGGHASASVGGGAAAADTARTDSLGLQELGVRHVDEEGESDSSDTKHREERRLRERELMKQARASARAMGDTTDSASLPNDSDGPFLYRWSGLLAMSPAQPVRRVTPWHELAGVVEVTEAPTTAEGKQQAAVAAALEAARVTDQVTAALEDMKDIVVARFKNFYPVLLLRSGSCDHLALT